MIRHGRVTSLLPAMLLGLAVFAVTIIQAAAADRVVVRAGVHKDFGRMVFDWQKTVDYSAAVKDRVLTIRFGRPIDPVFGKLVQDLDPYIGSVKLSGDKKIVTVTLNNDYRLRTSTIDSHVIVDLVQKVLPEKTIKSAKKATSSVAKKSAERKAVAPATPDKQGVKLTKISPATPVPPATGKAQSPGGVLPIRTGKHENYGRLVFGWPRKIGFTVERQGQNVTINFEAPAKVDIAELRRNLPRQITGAILRPSNDGLALGLIVLPDAQLRYFHNETDIVFDVVSKREKVAIRKAPRKKATKRARKTNRKKKKRSEVYPFVSVSAAQNGSEMILQFNWRKPVSAAVFRRDTSLWVHFDQPARLEMGAIQSIGNSRFRSAEQKNFKNAVHLRIPVPDNATARMRRRGTVWVVEIGPGKKPAIQNFPLAVRDNGPQGAELLIKVEKPGGISVIHDEVVGDSIYLVPVYRTGRGFRRFRRFPDFEFLKSPLGLAIRPIHDALRVRTTRDGIVLSKPGGLNISPAAAASIRRGRDRRDENLLNLAKWRHGEISDFKKIELELVQYVTQPRGVRRNAARLGLAKFYIAHGMGAEALGVINTLLKDTPQILREPGVRVLRGIGNYLVGHYAEADADLSHAELAGIRELYPWRAGIAAARGDWAGAYRLFVDTDVVIATLPSEFAVKLGLLAAEASLSVKEKEIAEARLGAVESLPASGAQRDQLAFLNGHLLKLKGETAKAIAAWEGLVKEGVRPVRAKAAFARINTLVDTGAIKAPDAVKQLEELQFAWRNSVFEFDLLNKLGELHASQRNLRSALVTLREAVTLFKDIKGAQSVTQRMRDMFRKFYLEGEADHLRPVVALGLYNEFRELTPTGADGDKMIRLLSERLIKVDLLEDAAKLLDHQVRFRLKGEERARTGARLAEILLLDEKPQDALTALAASEFAAAPEQLSEKRRHLEAAALMDSRRYDEALNNIAEDFTEEFDILRAQIYWRAGDWRKASRTLARLTSSIDSGKMRPQDGELLLRRAVALGLANDFSGMQFLRERFGAAMEKSPQAASFKAVAGGKLLRPKNFAALARRAAELDTFRAFMKTLNSGKSQAAPEQGTVLN